MRKFWQRLVETTRLMVGVKDYDTYVARRRRFNPEAKVMTKEEFFRYCQTARYSGKSANRCPC
ncbi:YbdD/YjiX family protein [Paludibacterium denitrificans]|uniref:Putative selenoprotein n=1 Tax=Paludibacterium denitrificans TaxID=2675226 RepID=A0A844GC11_9NEIS|nr:CstA-like transporter-associated (seleno)protein [Paludibacterium denitrificans]MTD33292.1 putative selenoprotein [Paludibacterium denitrificans]HJV06870.1 CstA-like transporter-associated (seleno)protein [Chromobacteriaceae bacterium]